MKRAAGAALGWLLALATALPAPALASGGGSAASWAVQARGPAVDQPRFYAGSPGIVMPGGRIGRLLIAWRGLHGLATPTAIADRLDAECCDLPPVGSEDAQAGWRVALAPVLAAQPAYFRTEREGSEPYTYIANCFDDAIRTATATLTDRIARFGAGSPDVRGWAMDQQIVFQACGLENAPLPPLAVNAPGWRRADRAYQGAAIALYTGKLASAAAQFNAIARDTGSPWRPLAAYLAARALARQALGQPTSASLAAARAALAAVVATPGYGREAARGILKALDFRSDPAIHVSAIAPPLVAVSLPGTAPADLFDLWLLRWRGVPQPEIIDWIVTLRGETGPPESRYESPKTDREAALTHAAQRWQARHDPAWLIAALSLATPGDAVTARLTTDALAAEALAAERGPAAASLVFHRVRLNFARGDAANLRRSVDTMLARRDIGTVTRNLFVAERAQLAENLTDFARRAVRQRLCAEALPAGCTAIESDFAYQPASLFDGVGTNGRSGLGDDARWVIDRMPLVQRLALADDSQIPALLRLDIALGNYVRAVQLSDRGVTVASARQLIALLPPMRREFASVVAAAPGPARRFAELLPLAKMPGARADLLGATRPEGRVTDFQGYWPNWFVAAPGRPDTRAAAPAPADYGSWVEDGFAGGSFDDPVCYRLCGMGGFVPRLPDFVAAAAATAARERLYLLDGDRSRDGSHPPPPGAVSVWDTLLDFARANPRDPRAPETLHWLIHVSRYGSGNNRSGYRAFVLLHQRYPSSPWTARNRYYYD
jgi:hypothetical protein